MQYTDEAGLRKAMALIKGYIDFHTSGWQEAFSVGEGLTLEDGVLSVTLDSTVYIVLPSLPSQPAEENLNKLHLVPAGTQDKAGNNIYTEYLWIEDPDKPGTFKWERFGEYKMDADLSGYLKSENLVATVTTNGITVKKDDTTLFTLTAESNSLNMSVQGNQLSFALKQIFQNAVSSGLYKVAVDKYGRVVATTAVTLDDLTNLGVAKASEISTNIQDLEKAIDDEKTAREQAISTEATARANADTALEGKITTEEAARKTADETLQGLISNEISDRTTGDQAVLKAVAELAESAEEDLKSEATARANADTALGNRIKKVEDFDSSLAMTSAEATAMYNEIYGNNS